MEQQDIQQLINEQYAIILDREGKLKDTDYIAAKIAEGVVKKSEYAEKIEVRQQWRKDINAAQEEIVRLEAEREEEKSIEE